MGFKKRTIFSRTTIFPRTKIFSDNRITPIERIRKSLGQAEPERNTVTLFGDTGNVEQGKL